MQERPSPSSPCLLYTSISPLAALHERQSSALLFSPVHHFSLSALMHRSMYLSLIHISDRVLYVKDGEIEREYTPAEFDSLSDSTRKEMGLRPLSLSKLKPANQYQAHRAKLMEFHSFCFAYKKREPESLHIPSAELPVGETIAIIGYGHLY